MAGKNIFENLKKMDTSYLKSILMKKETIRIQRIKIGLIVMMIWWLYIAEEDEDEKK